MHNEAAIRVYLHEVHKVGTKERLLEIGTAEGFANSMGCAGITFSVLSTLDKPDALISSGLQFTQMPNASDVMTALGLIWFFEAASHWGTNTQQALDLLCEANEAVELAYGEVMWNEGATHGKGNISAAMSEMGKKGANARHRETRQERDFVKQYWRENIDNTLSNDQAADALLSAKVVRLSFRTLSGIVSEAKKEQLRGDTL